MKNNKYCPQKMLKIILATMCTLSFVHTSFAQVNYQTRYQKGYVKSNGTYVEPHYKTRTNRSNHENYSTSGNTNSYTGNTGSRARDYSNDASNYGSGQVIRTGERGGQYYVNKNGKKVYVVKR